MRYVPLVKTKKIKMSLIEEMSKILRGMSNKLTRLKVEGNNANKNPQGSGQRNPNQYKISFNP